MNYIEKISRKFFKTSNSVTNEIDNKLEFVIIETTTRCNIRCFQCNHYKNPYDLSMDNFRKLIPMLSKYKPKVQLNGHGETLLNQHFFDMLKTIRDIGCPVIFQTNGTLLNDNNIEQIIDMGVERLLFSIDAVTPELFNEIRTPSKLDQIVENVKKLNLAKHRKNKDVPQLSICFTAMRKNIHELPGVVKLASELMVKDVVILELKEFPHTKGQSLSHDNLLKDWIEKAEEVSSAYNVDLVLPPHIPGRTDIMNYFGNRQIDASDKNSYKGLKKACKWPFNNILIELNGNIRPCCVIEESYGNIYSCAFEDIWLSDKYCKLRMAIMTDTPPEKCLNCFFVGWEKIESP